MDDELTELDMQVLTFAGKRWKNDGARDTAIRQLFGGSPHLYFQRLHMLLDRPAAYRHDPLLVKRLRRLREQRQAARSPVLQAFQPRADVH